MASSFDALFDADKLKEEETMAQSQRQNLAAAQAITNALSNQHSAGEYFLGQRNEKTDVSPYFDQLQKGIEDPWARRKKLLDQVKARRDETQAVRTEKVQTEADDPNSASNKAQVALTEKLSPRLSGLFQNMTAEQRATAFSNPAVKAMFDEQVARAKGEVERSNKMAEIGATRAMGKDIPAAQVLSVDGGNTALSMIGDLKETLIKSKDQFGPVQGRLGGMNPLNTEAQSVQSQLKTAAQKIGTFLEDGKLTDKDVPKYEQMLPKLSDPPEVAANKLALIERLLAKKQASNIQSLKGSGYDTRGVQRDISIPEVPNMQGKKPAPKGPPPGTVNGGYVFKGGDPNDKKNWEKAQ